jgi:hypothetical protein
LFGGFRGGWAGRQHWKNRIQRKWMNMSPEEKSKFQEEWKYRCGPQIREEKPQQ